VGFGCEAYCRGCRLKSCKAGTNTCTDCKGMAFDALLQECNVKQAQIDAQKVRVEA
jgi:hypothetical protein